MGAHEFLLGIPPERQAPLFFPLKIKFVSFSSKEWACRQANRNTHLSVHAEATPWVVGHRAFPCPTKSQTHYFMEAFIDIFSPFPLFYRENYFPAPGAAIFLT